MADYRAEIDAALASQGEISRDKVKRWVESATDLPTLAKLYEITGEGYSRIKPELGKELECRAIQNYLLECIRQDVKDDDEIESRWEAAGTLHFWLRHLLEKGDASDIISGVSSAITELFLSADHEVRLAIEQGFLEHALESAGLRPYFEQWSRDEKLCGAWQRAMEWAEDHPDYTWDLLVNHKHRGRPI